MFISGNAPTLAGSGPSNSPQRLPGSLHIPRFGFGTPAHSDARKFAIGLLILECLLALVFAALRAPASIVLGACISFFAFAYASIRVNASRRARLARLISRYNDVVLARRIFERQIWQGQTARQLLDTLGEPAARDAMLSTTSKRELWKYNPRGWGRHRLRIILEDEIVAAWYQD